ncbi:sensor histidine kinase [Prochlorococcus sp. MIT 1307]|uniref:sensor histidine kinase n=1 Tax=Prochlorococcus sp. MIT 1307 TaxID=3096219 RepID=UPI002A758683|nr:sensor histidine kinase [Prochlorococcus sp. MIT 1307]
MSAQISLSAIQERMAQDVPNSRVDEQTARRMWWGALDTLQDEILGPMELDKGLWLASPLPALYEPRLLDKLQGWVWAPEALERLNAPFASLLPPSRAGSVNEINELTLGRYIRLPLRDEDGHDPFLMIITPDVQVALALQGPPGERNLLMRSDSETIRDLLRMLDLRFDDEDPKQARELRFSLASLGDLRGNDGIQKIFWPFLSARLAGIAPSLTLQTLPDHSASNQKENESSTHLNLLEALTHEIRTPLATIRTLIRSLLRREDLSELVINRLNQIDSECTEQIDRFGLIFNAAELQRQPPESSQLAITDLGNMLEMLHPVWSQVVERRGIKLHLDISPDLPHVLSDPARLELMLGGLIDRNTRGLQSGGTLCLELRPAGQRLKLTILSKTPKSKHSANARDEQNSDLGPVLSWNPSTGSLQLTQEATQRLLASLGGRLTRRGESGLIIFFPIAEVKN